MQFVRFQFSLSQLSLGQLILVWLRLGQVQLDQFKLVKVRLGQLGLWYIVLVQILLGQIRVRLGQLILVQFMQFVRFQFSLGQLILGLNILGQLILVWFRLGQIRIVDLSQVSSGQGQVMEFLLCTSITGGVAHFHVGQREGSQGMEGAINHLITM